MAKNIINWMPWQPQGALTHRLYLTDTHTITLRRSPLPQPLPHYSPPPAAPFVVLVVVGGNLIYVYGCCLDEQLSLLLL